jgi:diadenylate cyclase
VTLTSGLGARHAAAAALTAITSALAVVVSQSTGTMSLFKAGGLVMALERQKA